MSKSGTNAAPSRSVVDRRVLALTLLLWPALAACGSEESSTEPTPTEVSAAPTEEVVVPPPPAEPEPVPANVLSFKSTGNGSDYLATGWSTPEDNFVWSIGETAELVLPAASMSERLASLEGDGAWTLNLVMFPFLADSRPEQSVEVFANEISLGTIEFSLDDVPVSENPHSFALPDSWTPDDELKLTFEIADPRSPAEVSDSPDERSLGVALASISFDRQAAE